MRGVGRNDGGAGVTVGLLDTAIDADHPDLADARLETRVFVTGRADAGDSLHGTASALLLVGQGRWRMGGVIPMARLVAASVVGKDGIATPQAIIAAIRWVVAEGANVIAIPLTSRRNYPAVRAVVEHAARRGALVFAAAPESQLPTYPANYPGVVAVTAACGGECLIADADDRPRSMAGSSIACIKAAGAAALAIASRNSGRPYAEVDSALVVVDT